MDRLSALPPDLQCRIWAEYTGGVTRASSFELVRIRDSLRPRKYQFIEIRRATLAREMRRMADALWEASFASTKPKDPFHPLGETVALWCKTMNFERGHSNARRVEHWLDLDVNSGVPSTRPLLYHRPLRLRAGRTMPSQQSQPDEEPDAEVVD